MQECCFWKSVMVNLDWEQLIYMVSDGPLIRDTGIFLKWIAIFHIIHHDLDKLYKACKNGSADVAVGSRYVKGGNVENWPWIRVGLSKGASVYTRIITLMPVKDPTAGFVCYRSEVLEAINLDKISFIGYAFQIEMKFAAWKLGFKIREVPIIFIDRKYGVSKMNKGIVKEGIFGVLKLKWMSMFKNYRSRVKNVNDDPSYQSHKIMMERKLKVQVQVQSSKLI